MMFARMPLMGSGRNATACCACARWVAAFVILFAQEAFADAPTGMQPSQTVIARLSIVFNSMWAALAPVMASFGSIPEELVTSIRDILASSTTQGRGELLVGSISLFVMMTLPGLWGKLLRDRWGGQTSNAFEQVWKRFALDCGFTVAVAIVAVLINELVSEHKTLAGGLAAALVDFGFRFFVAMMVLAILSRPREAAIRLLPGNDATVSGITVWLGVAVALAIGFTAVIPSLLQAGMKWPTAQAFAIFVGTFVTLFGYQAANRYLAGLPDVSSHWHKAKTAAAVFFWLCWCYGVIRLDFPFFESVVTSGIILTISYVVDRVMVKAAATSEVIDDPKKRALGMAISKGLRRINHVVAVLALSVVMARWGKAVFEGTVREAGWTAAESAVSEAALVVCLGYCLFEFISIWIQSTFERPRVNTMPGDDEDVAPASRLSTVVPLLQGAVGFAILAVTALVAIAKLGIDITPILAGAGILGLAISFGSQSLVRDVVAGIFYMADDAFRVGEYIEAAKLRGTIEKISIRSMRLRHHNGHVHTIAFGQLGFVTNFSRDWVTMKFNLRLRKDSDFETVRKVTKRLGQELLLDDEYGSEFIQQLKLQGLAEVTDTALVFRFKFTVKPGKPTVVQRLAMKRLLKAFAENGIEFANNAVFVQSDESDRSTNRAAAADANLDRRAAAQAP
jgi:small-conductance mechanosensitive channel